MHSTAKLDDGYMGSGTKLRYSIRKYGIENHIKEILEFLPNREMLILRESEIINKELLLDNLCMNLKEGGSGGFSNKEHMIKCSKAGKAAFNEKLISDTTFKENWINKKIKSQIKSYEEGVREKKYFFDWNGKKHNEKTKNKMSETKSKQGIGSENSQFGTCWITKESINKKIKKEELDSYLKQGWNKGRKF